MTTYIEKKCSCNSKNRIDWILNPCCEYFYFLKITNSLYVYINNQIYFIASNPMYNALWLVSSPYQSKLLHKNLLDKDYYLLSEKDLVEKVKNIVNNLCFA